MLAVVFDEVNDADAISQYPLVGFQSKLELLVLLRFVLDENILVLVLLDGLQSKDGAVHVEFLDLVQGEGVDVAEDHNFVGKDLVLFPLSVDLQNCIDSSLV
jgi:hypothetical protein